MATTDEVRSAMELLAAEFETFQVTEEKLSIWADLLAAVSVEALKRGLRFWLETSGSQHAPSIASLLKAIRDSKPHSHPPVFRGLPEPEMSEETKKRLREEARRRAPQLFN